MKSFAAKAVIGLLFLVGSASASEVTNVELRYQDGTTVASIYVQGPIRFTHETEVPKNGRPHRVIVDILAATHELGAKEFLSLPPGRITGIRTSQYSVTPEKIVRVVFDLSSAPLYRVDSKDGAITITFEGKNTERFPTWSTVAVMAGRAADKQAMAVKPAGAQKPAPNPRESSEARSRNQAIESDRLASLAGEAKSKPPAIPAKVAKAPSKPKAPLKTSNRSFSARTFSDEPPEPPSKPAVAKTATTTVETAPAKTKAAPPKVTAKADAQAPSPVAPKKPVAELAAGAPETISPTPKPVVKKVAPVAQTPKPVVKKATPVAQTPKPVVKKVAPVAQTPKPVVKKAAPVAQAPKPAVKKAVPVAQAPKPAVKKAAPVAQAPKPAVKKAVPVAQAPKPAPAKADAAKAQRALAQKVTGNASSTGKPPTVAKPAAPKPRATARFRRKASSAKIRGTMIAEFPKRLVIKYKANGRRDPFGSLIDDSRTYNNPVETRIPNIEGLKLVGVIDSEVGSNSALFEDQAGFSYMLKAGNKVRNGYVLRVDLDQVYFQIFEYGWSRTVALSME